MRAGVDRRTVDVGDPFRYQVAVGGTDQVIAPDLDSLRDFTVRPLAAGANNSESVTVINGKTTREVRLGYVLTYHSPPPGPARSPFPRWRSSPAVCGGTRRRSPWR